MGILFQFWRDMQQWDAALRWSFGIAFVLQAVLLVVLALGRDRVPMWALIGVIGLGIMMQAVAFYGNRHLVTPYTQAQRRFLAGDFKEARVILERYIERQTAARGRVSADAYVLLGNTLRNLGDLPGSERVLRRAVEQQPDYPFALYGLGRTLLTMGRWDEAIGSINKSLLLGAPPAVSFELAYATLELGDSVRAQELLEKGIADYAEPYRRLMALWLLNRLLPDDAAALRDGLGFWEREASLYRQTAYGAGVARRLEALRAQIGQA